MRAERDEARAERDWARADDVCGVSLFAPFEHAEVDASVVCVIQRRRAVEPWELGGEPREEIAVAARGFCRRWRRRVAVARAPPCRSQRRGLGSRGATGQHEGRVTTVAMRFRCRDRDRWGWREGWRRCGDARLRGAAVAGLSRGSLDWIALALAHAPAAAADGPAKVAEAALVRVDWEWACGASAPGYRPFWQRGSRRPSKLAELAAS